MRNKCAANRAAVYGVGGRDRRVATPVDMKEDAVTAVRAGVASIISIGCAKAGLDSPGVLIGIQ